MPVKHSLNNENQLVLIKAVVEGDHVLLVSVLEKAIGEVNLLGK